MNKAKLFFTLLITFLVFNGHMIAQELTRVSDSIPEGVEVIYDVPYTTIQIRELLLDIYKPSNRVTEILPTILVIKGGGWVNGNKEGYRHIASAIALRGFTAICVEYRGSDEATFPAAILDVKTAIKWIKDNASEYNFDSTSIGVIGGSAGAHLAFLAGVTTEVDSLNPTGESEDFSIQALVGLATPTDLTEAHESKVVIKWLGKPYLTNEELWESASPVTFINENSPPMLFVHSGSDNGVPYEQAISAVELLGKAGVHTELLLFSGAPHSFYNYEEWFGYTMDKAASFFHEQLKK